MNVDYIRDITETKLEADGYRVHLRASLSGNLDLTVLPEATGIDWQSWIAGLDAPTSRLVIFAVNPGDETVTAALGAARAQGIEAIVHRTAAEKPLKFGFVGTQADAAY